MLQKEILKGALIGGSFNGLINGVIQWFKFRDAGLVPVTVDCISNSDLTVLGTAVSVAITLSMIITVTGYFAIKGQKVGFIDGFIWILFKNMFFTFGVVTAYAVLWQYIFKTVYVSPLSATLLIGVLAFLIGTTINYSTVRSASQ